jgi:hypothetical protein
MIVVLANEAPLRGFRYFFPSSFISTAAFIAASRLFGDLYLLCSGPFFLALYFSSYGCSESEVLSTFAPLVP